METREARVAAFIIKYGKQYKPAFLPKDIKRGKLKTCFDTCLVQALDGKYRYVEGLAKNPRKKDDWILHAWLTDGRHAFDPTWYAADPLGFEMPVPTIYIGIEMPTRPVAMFIQATEYTGIFANSWRDPERAKQIIKNIPI